jgi:hypothetical protein
MGLANFAPGTIKPTALALNVLVSAIGCIRFYRRLRAARSPNVLRMQRMRIDKRLVRWAERNQRRCIERAERNPCAPALLAALAERDASGTMQPVDDFVRRFKKAEAERWPAGATLGTGSFSRRRPQR